MRSNQVCEFCPIHTSHGALFRIIQRPAWHRLPRPYSPSTGSVGQSKEILRERQKNRPLTLDAIYETVSP